MTSDKPVVLPDALLSQLSVLLESQMGLHFPSERWRDMERGLAAASHECGYADIETFVRWLLSAPLTRPRIEALASHLTVGETYFFRERASLDILEQQLLPALLRARAGSERRLRVWSAGCCTGEEPYSIAMMLDRLLPDAEDWNLTILATDINPRALRKAAEGVYGAWSFRDTPNWVKELHFTKRHHGHFEIEPRIRRMVTFSYLNLADDAYPSLVNGTTAMDVIFCRNVLMYFTEDRARSVVDKLYRSLVEGGWLITSPAETSNLQGSAFTPVEFPGAFLYRRLAAGKPRVGADWRQRPSPERERAASVVLAPPPPPPPAPAKVAPSAFVREVAPETGGLPATQPGVTGLPEREQGATPQRNARVCADEGRLAEAISWCELAIAGDKLNPAHHYLLAAICQERGERETAERALGRALYLEPEFALAHFALGNLCMGAGRQREARRHFANALTVLHAYPPEAPLPESDGLTAGRLAEIIAALQASQPSTPEEQVA